MKYFRGVMCAAVASVCLACSGMAAQQGAGADVGTTGEKQGYWWGKDKPKEEPKIQSTYQPLPPPPPEQALLALHPKEVEKLLEDYRQNAVWQATPETVRWYYELQDFARRRSRAFMNVTEKVMLDSPDLNMQTVYPTNPVGQDARVAQRNASIEARLQTEASRAALIMLSRASCGYCEEQRKILNHFQAKHGWDVREIDIDQNPEMASKFGATFTPTTVVIFRDNQQWAPVALGVETVEKVEESTYRAIRFVHGEVEADQYTLQEFNDGGIYDPRRSTK